MKRPPSPLARLLPWRRVSVELRFGPRSEADVTEVLAGLGEVLGSENDFRDDLKLPAEVLLAQLQGARTTAELIRMASRV